MGTRKASASSEADSAPAKSARAVDSKTRLLDAAATIVAREGAAHLTIDRVALEAGLSKGGVLYHYPSKRALLEGMLQKLMLEMEVRTEKFRQSGTCSELGAWIQAEQQQTGTEQATPLALLANAAEDPTLLDPARLMISDVFAKVATESDDPDHARILLLAVEGIRFMTMLKLLPFDPAVQQRLHARMLTLAEGLSE